MAFQQAVATAFQSIFPKRQDDDVIDRLHYFLTPTLLVSLAVLVSFKQFGGKPIECMTPEMFTSGWEQALGAALQSVFHRRIDDDITDRIHYFLTPTILLFLAVVVSFKQFGGKPIECLVPEIFSSSWEQYAENYCWAQDTYYLPFNIPVPRDINDRDDHEIGYYQWVPFFMLLQSFFFVFPLSFWKLFSNHSGIQIFDIIKMAKDPENIKPEQRKTTIEVLSMHLENALRFQRRLRRKSLTPHKYMRCFNLPYHAYFVTVMYLTTKILFLVNVTLQFFAMNAFLGTGSNYRDSKDSAAANRTLSYNYYGWGALSSILKGTTWFHSGYFPRVTLCDFQVRVHGNIQRYTIQCVLTINLFTEKIFIFLWFWFMILFFLTLISFVYWFILLVLPWPGRMFVERHLELSEMPFDAVASRKDVIRFASRYLSMDGLLVLRMVTSHCGILIGTDLTCSLYRRFYGIEDEVIRQESCDWPAKRGEMDEEDETSLHNLRNQLKIIRTRGSADPAPDIRVPSNRAGNESQRRTTTPRGIEDDRRDLIVKPHDLENYIGFTGLDYVDSSSGGPTPRRITPAPTAPLKSMPTDHRFDSLQRSQSTAEQDDQNRKVYFSKTDEDDDTKNIPKRRTIPI